MAKIILSTGTIKSAFRPLGHNCHHNLDEPLPMLPFSTVLLTFSYHSTFKRYSIAKNS